jgi:hypothetical protein
MTQQSIQELQRFITDYRLRREDGLIIFEGTITLCKTNTDFYSEILVVTLPEEMVLYVMEFGKPGHPENDMYRATDHLFTCLPDKKLELTDLKSGNRVIISLAPQATPVKK